MKKIKLNNGNNVRVFERKDLTEKLGLNNSEADIVLNYQRDFPELLQEHKENECIVDGRNFWEKLDKPQGDFSHWFNRKVIKRGYMENIDYRVSDKSVENLPLGGRPQTDYKFTIEAAKHVALSEQTPKGREVRDYFILMERSLREMEKWIGIRESEKEGYKELKSVLNSNYQLTHDGKEAPEYIYTNEADMINKCLFGKKAREIRMLLEMDDDITRDHLRAKMNNALYEIQILDKGMIMGGVVFKQRREIIENVCKAKYADIKLLTYDFVS